MGASANPGLGAKIAIMNTPFFQSAPELLNQYKSDILLCSFLKDNLAKESFPAVDADLNRFGERVVKDILLMAQRAEAEKPLHVPFDPWGRRVDEIKMSPAWDQLAQVAAEEGIVATGYERKYGESSRLVQFAKLYLFHSSSAFFSCPLAMTDGAARAIELYGDEELKKNAYMHLISRNPEKFWTSGQWMTERTGGSDVSGTSTVAKHIGGDRYELHGTKWFTSATTSQMAMTLARIEGHPEGSRGLSLFYLELRDQNGALQNIEVHRLKEKLGTSALPTAELTLKGTPAKLVGGEGHGVKKIAALFNLTRMYNSVCALSATRRALVLAQDYSEKRSAFGRKIIEHPLHRETLSELLVEFEGNFHLTFHLAKLLGREEMKTGTAEESAVMRLLTPIAKLYTAKSCMAITSEVVEIFGGAGYVEDTGLPRLLRDAQVFSIWEGTTNVLALDVVRAIEKENAFPPFIKGIYARLQNVKKPELSDAVEAVKASCEEIQRFLPTALNEGMDFVQGSARHFAFSLARTHVASLLIEAAQLKGDTRSQVVAKRWVARGLTPLLFADKKHREESSLILDRT